MNRTTDELLFLQEIRETILTKNLLQLSMGTPFFHQHGVLVTDDVEQEYLSEDHPETVVETEHAQELSWLLTKIRDNMQDTMSGYRREEFFGLLADAATMAIAKTGDRTAILLAVTLEASMLAYRTKRQSCDVLKDEVLSCAASLSELAEKI